MKIFIIKIPEKFRPKNKLNYPEHHDDYGVEQDFYDFLKNNDHFLTNNPNDADWHYLPVFWTRWHVNHNYAKNGLNELNSELNKKIISHEKTFTICQYADGPLLNNPISRVYVSSRNNETDRDIPLLSKNHKTPFIKPRKKYLFSFVGRINTHEIRKEIFSILDKKNNIFLEKNNIGTHKFVKTILKSYVVISPRGYGGNSFRFYEAMQLGSIPFLVGDIDTRPFKNQIEWDKCSFYAKDISQFKKMINNIEEIEVNRLKEMGKISKKVYDNSLNFKKWCNLLINDLKDK